MRIFSAIGLIALVIIAALAYTSLFIVDETKQALVLEFGKPIGKPITRAGLHFKRPYHSVVMLEKRVLNLDPEPQSFLLVDQKPLQVDYYVRYRISKPLNFFTAVGTEIRAESRLQDTVNAQMRAILGQVDLDVILSEQRTELLEKIRDTVSSETEKFGIQLVDVRIGKADLPDNISLNVFSRMKSERERLAAKARAEGKEIKLQEESRADLAAASLVAAANRDAQAIRGKADAEATEILNAAYNSNPKFFKFLESLDAYRASLASDNTYMVLSTDLPFFDVLKGK